MINIRYENYPVWIVIISNLVSLAIYVIGAFIILKIGIIWLVLYLLYILLLEIRLLRKSCIYCCYYGKVCAFGKGKISRLFFKQGDSKLFSQIQITWKDIIPDFLVSIIPLIIGIILLIISFDLPLLFLMILLVILTSFGNGIVRGRLACKYCKQLDLGCPAAQLFSKNKKS
ncbi:MAG: hypothetical protein NT145_07690 [Elusimicrobia bacterium]|nr:hypothetical protein [Elusimicrobiota bacterium]